MAARASHGTFLPIPAELPEQLSRIFSDHVTFPKAPLPARITGPMCAARQLYEWNVHYEWSEIFQNFDNADNDAYAAFMRKMATRVNRWRERNLISRMTPQSGSVAEKIIDGIREEYSDTQLFFGVIGELDLNNYTFTPAHDQDGSQDFLPQLANPPSYPLPPPREPPAYFRQRADLDPLDTWLKRNPTIYQHFFPAKFDAWMKAARPTHPIPSASAQMASTSIQKGEGTKKRKRVEAPNSNNSEDAEADDAETEGLAQRKKTRTTEKPFNIPKRLKLIVKAREEPSETTDEGDDEDEDDEDDDDEVDAPEEHPAPRPLHRASVIPPGGWQKGNVIYTLGGRMKQTTARGYDPEEVEKRLRWLLEEDGIDPDELIPAAKARGWGFTYLQAEEFMDEAIAALDNGDVVPGIDELYGVSEVHGEEDDEEDDEEGEEESEEESEEETDDETDEESDEESEEENEEAGGNDDGDDEQDPQKAMRKAAQEIMERTMEMLNRGNSVN